MDVDWNKVANNLQSIRGLKQHEAWALVRSRGFKRKYLNAQRVEQAPTDGQLDFNHLLAKRK